MSTSIITNRDDGTSEPRLVSHSQAGQDLFALAMTEGRRDGYFLDIGCNHESFHSNTYALEQIGWNGLMVDIVGGCENRRGTFIQCDASNPGERLMFLYSQMPDVVDYLSLDVDDALIPVLTMLPMMTHTFRVVTAEHDRYRVGDGPRNRLREMMMLAGYELVCGDVIITGYGEAEDWFVSPQLVNPGLVKKFRCHGKDWREILA